MSGLLNGAGGFDPLAPGDPFRTPAVNVTKASLELGRGAGLQAMLAQLGRSEDEITPEIAPWQAALQPSIPPAGTPWQEEVIFDRIARTDDDIGAEMMYYFTIAQNYHIAQTRRRVAASEYYNGRPLGDEEPGRSQLVMTTVRDTIRATLPSLLRIFTAVENPVEFAPAVADNEQLGLLHAELARQATMYCHWALFTANNGWIALHDAILDALTRKVGWLRWYWGQQRASRVEECERLLLPQLQALLAEPGITAQRIVRRPMLPNEIRSVSATPEGQAYLQAGPPMFYSARITRAAARAWPIIEAVPTECVWIVADASETGNARAIFHVRDVPASDLIAAGLPADKVLRSSGEGIPHRYRMEVSARDVITGQNLRGAPPNDASMRMVRYTEGWCRMDTDGDGIAELIHTHAVGMSPKLIRWDRTDEIPLAGMTPYREPGRVFGFSQADMVMDLQRTETRLMRSVLDSLGQSIYPRTVAVVGQANLEDTRQTAIGAIIRVSQQGAVTELTKPFVGAQALPVLEVLESIRESRTGITRTSQGLTAEALQSTTPTAVSAQTSASQDRLDMIARTLAETGLAPLYRGLLRMMAAHQDRPNVLSIRGKWVTIDPRALSIMWQVQVNVGAKGTMQERLGMLATIAGKQEQILAPAVQAGQLDTPLVGLPEYRNTLARMCEVAGIADVVSYFKDLPPNWQPPAPPPPQPSTDQILAQVEQQKTQAEIVDEQGRRDNDRLKILLDDGRSRDETAVNAWVNAYKVAAQFNTPLPSIDEFKGALKPTPPGAPGVPAPPGSVGPPGAMAGPAGAPALGAAGPSPSARPGGLGAAQGAALMPPPGGIGQPGRVGSLPLATPPVGTPAGANVAADPATVLAMRRAMLARQGAGGLAATILGNRAGMPAPSGQAGGP